MILCQYVAYISIFLTNILRHSIVRLICILYLVNGIDSRYNELSYFVQYNCGRQLGITWKTDLYAQIYTEQKTTDKETGVIYGSRGHRRKNAGIYSSRCARTFSLAV